MARNATSAALILLDFQRLIRLKHQLCKARRRTAPFRFVVLDNDPVAETSAKSRETETQKDCPGPLGHEGGATKGTNYVRSH
jgi:hypothetical protein